MVVKREIKSELLLASWNAQTGDILYTFVWTYPRFILSEVNTHRMFSRNTSSSRAIPAARLRKDILEDPFVPRHIGANQKGMQASGELEGWHRTAALAVWSVARYPAVAAHYAFEKLGVHKQITNRLIEPWMWAQQLLSTTEIDNFLSLRNHWMAEPHIAMLAKQVDSQVYEVKSFLDRGVTPEWVKDGKPMNIQVLSCELDQMYQWHLPFIQPHEYRNINIETLKKVSAARCARVSYFIPETGLVSTIDRDLELFARLAESNPKHLSPLEHVAHALPTSQRVGNFTGFKQFRKEIPGEDGVVTK